MTIANQKKVTQNIKNLFRDKQPERKSPLTPTQTFVAKELRPLLLKNDGEGKERDFSHFELRRLKDTKTILLVSVVGKKERFILIGPRGHVEQLDSKAALADQLLDDNITGLLDENEQGTS